MRVSTRGRYGLRAMLDLAMNEGDGPVPLSDISGREEISLYYLEQLFNKLKKAGLVTSKPGAGGGYTLAKPARKITVGDVIRCVEGPIAPVLCAVEGDGGKYCSRSDDCITRVLWKRLGEKIGDFLDSVTIDELCGEAAALRRGKRK